MGATAGTARHQACAAMWWSQIARATPNLRLLSVDYAQLLKAAGKDRYQQVTNISLALKGLAMSLNIPVIALSQLSRQLEV